MNVIKEKILKNEEKYYSYPIKVSNTSDANFLDNSKTTGIIIFGEKQFNYPKFWRNEKFKLPFNEFSIREYKDTYFEIIPSIDIAYYGEGNRVRLTGEKKSDLSVNKVFPALNFMGYLWQHFVQGTLPILYFGREFLQRNPDIVILLYSGISEDIVNYFFNLFEISNPIKYVSYEGCVISTNHLYNFESNVQIPTYWWNNFFYEGIHKLVNQSYKQEKKNVIYTKRLYRRTISNEDQLKDTLINFCLRNNLNFIEFEAEKYTIEERADIFRNTHTVISPHGGANYHLIFCPKGIKFIEYTFIDCLYTLYNIASSLELNYYVVPNYGTNETHSIEIDIHKLNMLLDL